MLFSAGAIPARLGQQTGTLTEGESVRYELNVPQDGVTVRLCVQEGYIIFYASFTVTNPNEALHDYKREVINEGTTSCDDAYINPAEVNTQKRQADGLSTGNATLYIALDGVEERNEYELNTSEGDTTSKG